MHRFAIYWLLTAIVMTNISCRKKNNPPPDDNQTPLNQLLPGNWNTISYKAKAMVSLSGVEYEISRVIKNGQISLAVQSAADRLHFEGQGTFETSIRVQGQNLQTMDQIFGYSDQNAAYQIIKFEKNRFEMARATGGSSSMSILVLVQRESDTKITISFQEPENIENLGMVEFNYEYTLEKTE